MKVIRSKKELRGPADIGGYGEPDDQEQPEQGDSGSGNDSSDTQEDQEQEPDQDNNESGSGQDRQDDDSDFDDYDDDDLDDLDESDNDPDQDPDQNEQSGGGSSEDDQEQDQEEQSGGSSGKDSGGDQDQDDQEQEDQSGENGQGQEDQSDDSGQDQEEQSEGQDQEQEGSGQDQSDSSEQPDQGQSGGDKKQEQDRGQGENQDQNQDQDQDQQDQQDQQEQQQESEPPAQYQYAFAVGIKDENTLPDEQYDNKAFGIETGCDIAFRKYIGRNGGVWFTRPGNFNPEDPNCVQLYSGGRAMSYLLIDSAYPLDPDVLKIMQKQIKRNNNGILTHISTEPVWVDEPGQDTGKDKLPNPDEERPLKKIMPEDVYKFFTDEEFRNTWPRTETGRYDFTRCVFSDNPDSKDPTFTSLFLTLDKIMRKKDPNHQLLQEENLASGVLDLTGFDFTDSVFTKISLDEETCKNRSLGGICIQNMTLRRCALDHIKIFRGLPDAHCTTRLPIVFDVHMINSVIRNCKIIQDPFNKITLRDKICAEYDTTTDFFYKSIEAAKSSFSGCFIDNSIIVKDALAEGGDFGNEGKLIFDSCRFASLVPDGYTENDLTGGLFGPGIPESQIRGGKVTFMNCSGTDLSYINVSKEIVLINNNLDCSEHGRGLKIESMAAHRFETIYPNENNMVYLYEQETKEQTDKYDREIPNVSSNHTLYCSFPFDLNICSKEDIDAMISLLRIDCMPSISKHNIYSERNSLQPELLGVSKSVKTLTEGIMFIKRLQAFDVQRTRQHEYFAYDKYCKEEVSALIQLERALKAIKPMYVPEFAEQVQRALPDLSPEGQQELKDELDAITKRCNDSLFAARDDVLKEVHKELTDVLEKKPELKEEFPNFSIDDDGLIL